MKARTAQGLMKSEIFIALYLFLISIIGFNLKTSAQGWGFTFNLTQTGPCGSSLPAINLPPIPNVIPTQAQCEALRQSILAIRESWPIYDNRGNYIGDCALFYTCTPCSGSDAVTSTDQLSSGNVSFDGQFEGQPFYTSHESSAFEDWSKDYRQELESYGITSILGNTLNAPHIPLTGDKEFDAFYNNQTANFNPKSSPVNVPANLDANVVDLSGKQGVVQLLRSPEDIKKENDWLQQEKLDNLKPIPKNGELDPIVLEEAPFWTSPDMVSLEIAAVGFAVPFAIALVPATAIGASVATAELLATPVMALVSEDYKALTDVLNDKTPASTGTILINTAKATATDFLFKKIDGGIGNKISNPVVKDIYDKLPGPGATIYGIWGPKD